MTKFVPRPTLTADVTARIAAPAAARLAAQVADATRAAAPAAKTWVTAHDERVRHTHRDADGQEIPENLRFVLGKPGGRLDDPPVGTEMARAPRDPDLSIANRINCRCEAVPVPGAIAAHVHASDPTVTGTQATARVSVTFPRVAESEFPSEPDTGGGWMRGAVQAVATGDHSAP